MRFSRQSFTALAVATVLASPFAVEAASRVPQAIAAAVADAHRPADDTARDAERKPAEMLAYAGVKPGDKIAELAPGGGYMTRLLSAVAGPKGHVYALNLPAMNDRLKAQIKPVTDDKAFSNVTVLNQDYGALKLPEPVDVVWTSLNYHDLKNEGMFHADTAAMDKAIFASLKPGGLYVVIDHAAAAGSGTRDTKTLHRIDPAAVEAEVLAAGFKLEGQSTMFANPKDAHTAHGGGDDDKFFFKFRKPG